MKKEDAYRFNQSAKDKAIHDLRTRVSVLESKVDLLLGAGHYVYQEPQMTSPRLISNVTPDTGIAFTSSPE